MSSLNFHFTFSYVQPGEYRFSHDSVFLARRAFEYLRDHHLNFQQGLDLCSGCGIVGLDFLYHWLDEQNPQPRNFDFIEVQQVYKSFFQTNLKSFHEAKDFKTPCQFLNLNYNELLKPEYFEKYDLILCNPPYFRKEHGLPSASEFKNRCRFFIDSDFRNLVKTFEYTLKPGGQAFALMRSLEDHGVDIVKEFQEISVALKLQRLEDVRGTQLYRMTKSGDSTPN